MEKNKNYFHGIVLDIGGRDRGKFKKPKQKVTKWIFADLEEKHNPDIVLDVSDMKEIETNSIDIINAIELFEHVEKIEPGLQECYRVLKRNGVMILSVPFLFQIHADPYDFQRWTEHKWRKKLSNLKFTIEKFQITGRFFTVLADMGRVFIKSMPSALRRIFLVFYPLLDLLVILDDSKYVQSHSRLGKFHGGYFMVLTK
ncbi:MAG: methyltransferase domain-containing protein [Ignavibacteria bacterium]|nr:methyltransferase domain-containing protein [Ignavibacteria bacterium]